MGGSNNPVPYANYKPTDLGEHLRQVFNLGNAPITQRPGPAAPSTRKFYQTHQGYDYGTPAGTPIRPAVSGKVVKSYTDNTGWGNRALIQLENGQSYFLNHLAKLPKIGEFRSGEVIGLTGGIPGTFGAGNTTGAHLDITPFSGVLKDVQQGASNFVKNFGQGSSISRSAKDMLNVARQKYGNGVVAVARKSELSKRPDILARFQGKAKIIRL